MAVFLLLAGMAAFFLPIAATEKKIQQDTEDYALLRGQLTGTASPSPAPALTPAVSQNEKQPFVPLPPTSTTAKARHTAADFAACQKINPDFIGWLQIPNTPIDYPVVQSDDTDYYLHHTFTGKESYLGTLFALERTNFQTPSQNIAIYGHHLRSHAQAMFSSLMEYKEPGFYENHATIYLDTLYHTGIYQIFAVLHMRNGDWEPSTPDFNSDEAFLAFIARAKALSLYDTGVEVHEKDSILTLITCDRSFDGQDGRLVIMAVEKSEPMKG